MYGYDICTGQKFKHSNYLQTNYDESRNSTTTTASGSNSTTSSKIKLSTSPTDSLAKNSHYLTNDLTEHTYCLTMNKTLLSRSESAVDNDECEKNSTQILKLIKEKKSMICPARNIKFNDESQTEFDMYSFSIFNSGGFIEIPKYCKFIFFIHNILFKLF